MSCSCDGFAFGETGELDLVRLRNNREIDRLSLSSFSSEDFRYLAVIPRWERQSRDVREYFDKNDPVELASEIRKRPRITIMNLADYDHDGQAAEFFIQTETQACGHRNGIVVGVSKRNPRLSAFGTVLHPNIPLRLEPREWEALKNSAAPTRITDTGCGDHGSDTELELD